MDYSVLTVVRWFLVRLSQFHWCFNASKPLWGQTVGIPLPEQGLNQELGNLLCSLLYCQLEYLK